MIQPIPEKSAVPAGGLPAHGAFEADQKQEIAKLLQNKDSADALLRLYLNQHPDTVNGFDQSTPFELKLGTIALTLVLCYFAYQLLFTAQPYIFLDYVDFVTHETGGVLFLFCNQFFFMLGQNIYQSLVPLLFLIYFFRRKAPASWSFCLFWLGDSVLQTGNYMKDATTMALPIITIWGSGGNDHDWNYIFSQTGLLPYDQVIGGFVWFVGALCIIASIAYLWYLSVKRISPTKSLA